MVEEKVNFNGQKLKQKRVEIQKTQAEVAEYLEITPQSYGEMEKGMIKPNANNLAKLSIFFDCPALDFFDIPEKYFAKI